MGKQPLGGTAQLWLIGDSSNGGRWSGLRNGLVMLGEEEE